ncbi:MAG: hypothetical protein IAF38_18475, partial [Bacteroidia bacterium]|nr:hypothetical protein [Bacteroidia bacterium]
MCRKHFFIIVTLLLSSFVSAQFYQIKNYNAESGLPSPEVYGMLQDSKGFMWFATDMGVSRYNGYEFKNYSTENGLPDNTVFGFFEDVKGRIWFRSFSGKLSYFLNDSIHVIPSNHQLEKDVKTKHIILVSLYVDEGDTVWVGTTEKFVLKIAPPWNEKNVSWIKIPGDGEYLFLIGKKALVFGGNSVNKCLISVFEKNLKRVTQITAEYNGAENSKHRYFGTYLLNGNFLASVDNLMFEFNKYGIVRSVKKEAGIIEAVQDKDKKIISVSYSGVCFHDPENFSLSENIPGFSDKIFTGIVIDRENGLWLSAEGHGVYYIPFRSGRYYTTEHGLPQSKISCIGEKNGQIFTGHLNGSVSVIKGNEIKNSDIFSQKLISTSSNRINCIYTKELSAVYVVNNFQVGRLSGENFKNSDVLSIGAAKKIIRGKDGFVWGIRDRLIILFDVTKNFKVLKEIRFNQYIDDVFEDSKGVLWVCGLNGLWNYYNDSLHYLGERNKLLSARFVHVLEDNKGRLWMASRGEGVVVKDGNKFFQVKQSDGLASNMCRSMFIDSANVVWVGSNNGLSRIQIKNENGSDFNYSVEVYSNKNGLLTNEVNYIVQRGNELLIAHNNGISIFNPSAFKNNTVPPPVYIVNTSVNNKTYKENNLRLDYSRSYLKINYVGLSFKNPGSVEYKYRMEGLDTSWVNTKYTSAQFQTLDPGNYTFSVYAKNDDGYWSSSPATLRITIIPAWWQTWVFRIFSFLFFTGIIYFFVKKRINKFQKRENEKNALQ